MSDQMTSPKEYISSKALKDNDPRIRCTNCQHLFSAQQWQPRLRCPNCDVLGYPDRAGLNLLPLGWECETCHAQNSGMHNFCTTCASGLTSRCVQCEAPVYSAACTRCGTHQAHALRINHIEADRSAWVNQLRTQFRSDRIRSENLPAAQFNPSYGVAGWRSLAEAAEVEEEPEERPVRASPRQLAVRNVIKWSVRSIALAGIGFVGLAYLDRLLFEMLDVSLLSPFLAEQEQLIISVASDFLTSVSNVDPALAYASLMLLVGAALIPLFVVLSRQISKRIIP